MKRTIHHRVLLLGAATLMAWASQAMGGGLSVQAGSKLWLEGKSTMHAFESTASKLKVEFQEDDTRWAPDAKGADAIQRFMRAQGVTAMEVVVAVTGLRSGKAGLDKNMVKALDAAKHPDIRFRMASYEVAEGKTPSALAIDAKGTLTVAGVAREVQVPVTAVREGDGVRMRGSVPLLMSQFGIKPPTMMMGALKTSDQVVVHFDLLLGTQASSTMSKAE